MSIALFTHVRQNGARLTVSARDYAKQLRRIHARDARKLAALRAQLARLDALDNAIQQVLAVA